MKFIMFTLLFMLAITGCYGNKLEVDYHIPDNQKVIYDVQLKHKIHIGHKIHKRSPSQPLRIHLHFDSSVDRLPYEHQTLIKGKVHDAVAFWEDTLMVHATRAPILLNRRCIRDTVRYYDGIRYCTGGCAAETRCGDITVPNSHLRSCEWYDSVGNEYHSPQDTMPGVNASFILYVAALSSDKCSWQKTVAFAAHCQQEQQYDRPVAGYFSICPKSVSTSIHKHEELLYTIKHEILHALGFTAGLYAFYRDRLGRPLTERNRLTGKPLVFDKNAGMYMWSDRVVKQYSRYAWKLKGQTIEKKVNMIITPNVVREVRNHFNCASLEGGELEDQGGINGTAITHWEKRVFENEFMTGTYTQNPVISRISLALMEDTGWYSVKYGNAKTLEWGKNLGCDFATRSCYEWIETKLGRNEDIHPFCIEATRGQPVTDCSRNRKAVAICNLSEFNKDLPKQYQYFRSIPGVPSSEVGRFGGSVALADYCPYLQEFVWKQDSDFIRGSRCALVQNTLEPSQNYLLEKYSPRSKCFNHGSGWALKRCNNIFRPHSGSGCYEYECRSDTGLTIYVMERGYRCYYGGQVLMIDYADNQWLYRGNITCPSCTEICKDQGVVCPQDDRSVYTVQRDRTYRIPCSEAINLSASICLALFTLFMSCCFF
ncbi:leishmanolysin-like peptidase isoform X1 [Mercenaria mercenaria]|uniref:leishmanolysin-like peptidase isoform X1 n=2 Tax=Mercenaria mercenaria TaxID=6596 RepID=UPI001E1DE986|nr:leishmanolysin-like peptidase isoform X1 [Mercenaria mercenaria]XP_045207500.1 leishmanolysin-like peptidase isoform X1 [Mercenaria mercenaria]